MYCAEDTGQVQGWGRKGVYKSGGTGLWAHRPVAQGACKGMRTGTGQVQGWEHRVCARLGATHSTPMPQISALSKCQMQSTPVQVPQRKRRHCSRESQRVRGCTTLAHRAEVLAKEGLVLVAARTAAHRKGQA